MAEMNLDTDCMTQLRNKDVVFMKDQTIQDIEKIETSVPYHNYGLTDMDSVLLTDLTT